MVDVLQAPFVWFGGKRKVAAEVWDALGDVDHYVEPFAGSLAVLLGRPARHRRKCETVNDADSYLSNFWRAIAIDPDAVAAHTDWPVNETDLFARHLWLVNTGRERLAKLEADPEFYDAKVAGWWVWGVNAWIGSGWCSGEGPWRLADTDPNRKLPHLGDAGRGVNRQLPHLGDAGQGVNRQLPHLGNAGQGVNRKLPHLGNAGQGTLAPYFAALADRLRRVRVCAGDWSRVVTSGALSYGASVGVFLDPPYSGDVCTSGLYAEDEKGISAAVRDWAVANGNDRRLRIVLAGYEAEHAAHMPSGWRMHAYTKNRAFGTAASATGAGNGSNRRNERLWFSPHCLNVTPALFDVEAS
jgi:hypothetical protein